MSDELKEYKDGIEKLFDEKSNLPIGNSQPAHAAALYDLFFRKTKSEVFIFCERLASFVFAMPDVRQSMQGALARGVTIHVLLQNKDHECPDLEGLKKCGKLIVKTASPAQAVLPMNFCVVDGFAYRFEKDKAQPVAFAKMYAPEEAHRLHDAFQEMWAKAA